MFVGMEHIVLSNHPLADEALFAANTMCDGDPLLKNEMGVMAYYHEKYVLIDINAYQPFDMYSVPATRAR